jgi:cell wall-associated NlpC family hydrolase
MRRVLCGAVLLGAFVVTASAGPAVAQAAGRWPAAGRPAAITAGLPGGGAAVWGLSRPLWPAATKAAAVTRAALAYLGRPYQWAGLGRGGFDCSGLVLRVFSAIGVGLPHTSFELYGGGTAVPPPLLGPGDLVFFHTYSSGPSHVGIYIGGNRFIHASASQGVIISSMDEPYYRARYLGARRY